MIRIRFIIPLIILLLIVSCSSSDVVEILDFSPIGKVERLTTFQIEFNKELASADIIDQWLEDEFIEFEPKINGKFKWVDSKTLIFSPDSPLQPIQDYRATPTPKVLFKTLYTLDKESFEFSTPDFEATKTDLFWTPIPNEVFKLTVQANIYFNYAVVPDQLKKYLSVKVDGKEFSGYSIVSKESSEIIAINLGEIKQTDKSQDVEITVNSGLESVIGKKPLQDSRSFENELPPITQLAITGVSSGVEGQSAWASIGTTQLVDEKKIKDFISIDPAVSVKYFVTDNQIRLEGDFNNLTSITLKIKKGLPGVYGGELEDSFEQIISLVDLQPQISFRDKKSKYLMLGGQQNIEISSVNVDKVEVEVSQVFKNNILHFLDNYSYQYDYDFDYSNYYYTGNFGRTLYSEKIDLPEQKNWNQYFSLNLNKAIRKDYKGLYVVSIRSDKDRWINDAKMIAISDLAIITKKGSNGIFVFVNSIKDAEPVEGVEVSVISSNNQEIFTGRTDPTGVIKFIDEKKILKEFTPQLITAQKDDDFNYIDLRETRIETSRFDVGGEQSISPNYKTFVYSERNIYRPGETVNLSAIIRDDKIGLIKEEPINIKVISPTGKVFGEYKKNLNEQRSFELKIEIPDYAQTGSYFTEIFNGSNSLIGSYSFSVEEFVPDKIRVRLTNEKNNYKLGEQVKIDVDAEYLFGAKAAEMKYQADIQLKHSPFYSKSFPKFDFTNSSLLNTNIENTFIDGKLNSEGKASFLYNIPGDLKGNGIISGDAFVSVFDLTGRAVNRIADWSVYPNKYYLGIKSNDYYFGTNQNITFSFAAVDNNDKPISSLKATAKLVRFEWQTVLKKDYSDQFYYASEKKEIVEWTREVDLGNTPKDFTFNVSRSGDYELRLSKKGDDHFVKKEFYAYGWGSSTASSFEVNKEGRVEIVLDKEKYSPNEKAKILFTTPFDGRMLVTVERNSVLEYQHIDVKNRTAELSLSLNQDYMPNVYITATLYKPHEVKSQTPFLVGHGFASLKVEDQKRKLNTSISALEEVKPRTKQKIKIKTTPNALVTFAAVDEGILQLTNYKSPNPYEFMYAKRPLGVTSYDLYKLLLPEIIAIKSSPGGDALANELKKRTNPITSKRFKLFSYWSGIKKANSNGEIEIDFDVPQFNGEVRLMAVSYDGNKFGFADKKMKVKDDLILEVEMPRFLAMNDSLNSTVTLINTTDKKGKVELSIETSGSIKSEKNKYSVSLNPKGTAQIQIPITAVNQIGESKITFTTSGLASVKESININVNPVVPYSTQSGSGVISADQSVKLELPNNYIQSTKQSKIAISNYPSISFADKIKDLVTYPYGCLEQTVSKAFPQIYLEDLIKVAVPQLYRRNNPQYYVKEGIRKVESMQQYNGGFSYWQGSADVNVWASVYATHFLLEAKKASYSVRESVIKNAINYLQETAKKKDIIDYVTFNNNMRSMTKIASKETIYALYVLAMANKADVSTMNYYKARPNLLTNDSRYLLAGAYALINNWAAYNQIVQNDFIPENTLRLSGGSFDSEVRANAIALNVLLEVDPTNKQIPLMVKHLAKISNKIYNTQETAFALIALGKAAKLQSSSDLKYSISFNGKDYSSINASNISLTNEEIKSNSVTIKAQGKGSAYYFWSVEGISLNNKVKDEDSNLKIRRKLYNYRTGQEITNGQFNQGDMILGKIELIGMQNSVDNIVINNIIPAGFEIENPRLTAENQLNVKVNNPMLIDYLDIRDDRQLIFTKAERNKSTEFYYLLRAVNKGNFTLPPISAESMYDNEYHSINGSGEIIIR